MTDDIVEWIEEEKQFCQEQYDEIDSKWATGREEQDAAFWFSGRIKTCERLLLFLSPKELTNDM